jgi:hypothetical protein
VSKRHQSNRRRTYGRRQHELHERSHRTARLRPAGDDRREATATLRGDLTMTDPRTPRLRAAGAR